MESRRSASQSRPRPAPGTPWAPAGCACGSPPSRSAGSGGRPKDLFPEQVIEAIQSSNNNNLKYIVKVLDKSESTVRRVIKESYNLNIVDGKILIDAAMSEGF